jgi:hypothetical protein
LAYGIMAALAWGYAYGILRANLISASSYFIYDAATIGLYLGVFSKRFVSVQNDGRLELRYWVALLIGWPIMMLFLPFQPIEVSLVGLRGNIFFLPAMLIGARLREEDLRILSPALAVLNLSALSVALGEYFIGLETFYPVNDVTRFIYELHDVAGGTAFRLPSSFTTPFGYSFTMVYTLPFLFTSIIASNKSPRRLLLLAGLVAALMGVLLAACRSGFVVAALFTTFAIVKTRVDWKTRTTWCILVACIGIAAMSNARFQRFTTLSDTDAVEIRIAGSVNRSFLDILLEYPMGNGLGGGGTSIPYFWEANVRRPVGLENEYS